MNVYRYISVNIKSSNDMNEEINKRIVYSNIYTTALINFLNQNYYHAIRSHSSTIATYAGETWSLAKGNNKRLILL